MSLALPSRDRISRSRAETDITELIQRAIETVGPTDTSEVTQNVGTVRN